jgi:hypothetical protein
MEGATPQPQRSFTRDASTTTWIAARAFDAQISPVSPYCVRHSGMMASKSALLLVAAAGCKNAKHMGTQE